MTNFVAAVLLILDWGLPNILGIDLLSQLRRHGMNLPTVFLTGDALAHRGGVPNEPR